MFMTSEELMSALSDIEREIDKFDLSPRLQALIETRYKVRQTLALTLMREAQEVSQ